MSDLTAEVLSFPNKLAIFTTITKLGVHWKWPSRLTFDGPEQRRLSGVSLPELLFDMVVQFAANAAQLIIRKTSLTDEFNTFSHDSVVSNR
jgi:hypothetical protein